MEFLEFLEGIRIPFVTDIMLAITYLGDEIAFLVAALVMFWCVDKRRGYLLLSVGFFGTITSQFMKMVFRVPRPWLLREGIADIFLLLFFFHNELPLYVVVFLFWGSRTVRCIARIFADETYAAAGIVIIQLRHQLEKHFKNIFIIHCGSSPS